MRTKTGSVRTVSGQGAQVKEGGKLEVSIDTLEKAWKEAKKMEKMQSIPGKGPMPPPSSNQPISQGKLPPMMMKMAQSYTRELGTKEAKVRVDAFLPMESCQGPTMQTLEKLGKQYKDKVYIRTYPLFGPAAGQVGIHCSTIFINGRNYVKVNGKEIVFGSQTTHNVQLIEKAIKQAIAEAYATPQQKKE
ncbi:hypothetical protein H5T88_06880 [bacterium]|nr:hypothetical protein [bacterium]